MSAASTAALGHVLQGVGVGRRAVVGPVAQVRPAPHVAADAPLLVDGVPADVPTAHAHVEQAFADVAARCGSSRGGPTGTVKDVLAATAQMADDKALRSGVLQRIDAGEPVVSAVDGVVEMFATMFEQAGGYLAERVTDLRSVRDRVVAAAHGPAGARRARAGPAVRRSSPRTSRPPTRPRSTWPTCSRSSPSSAAPPATPRSSPGSSASRASCGSPGRRRSRTARTSPSTPPTAPSPSTRPRVSVPSWSGGRASSGRSSRTPPPGATADGRAVALLANIGTAEDAARVAGGGVEGVGLFRTEVLFLESTTAPTLEAQAAVYTRVLRSFGDRKVVVRTLDAGADKPLAFATQPDEENPALGVRGYRLVRTHPELLDTQLEALAHAQAETGTTPWVMAPMIATAAEARDVRHAGHARPASRRSA